MVYNGTDRAYNVCMMTNPEMVRRIKRYLRQKNKTQWDLAISLGTSTTTVNRWLTGRRRIAKSYQTILQSKRIFTS